MLESFKKLRIIEVAEGITGPVCGLMFADLGAEVIKFEPPGGDRSREWGPECVSADGAPSSAIFEQFNRGKQSVQCNLASGAGRARLLATVAAADVVLVQLDPVDRAACGIDWRALAEQQAGLIVCEIDAQGERGPLAPFAGSELTVQALSGFTRYVGEPNGVPCRLGFEISAMAGGTHAFHAAAAALFARLRSGQGQYVHVSCLGALMSMKSILFAANSDPDKWEGFHLLGPRWPADTGWETRDGQITFDFRYQYREQWVAFCNAVGLGHLVDHPDYQDWRSTIQIGDRRHHYGQPYREVFARMTCAEASALINRCGGISVKFHDYAEVLAHPQTQTMEVLVQVPDAPAGAQTQIGVPFRYDGVIARPLMPRAPRLGEHDAVQWPARQPLPKWGKREVQSSGGPLQGIKVLDASMGAVGPWTGVLLGQLGADVVKLESPQGDFIRSVMPTQRGLGTTYIAMNLNKRGIVLDLKQPAQRAQVHALAQQADVFIENFRPGVADRIGVGYAELSSRNPRLIYASASGFGPKGPMVEIGATDPHIQPFTGTCSVNGLPGGKHQGWRWYGHFDTTTATMIVQGVLAALIERDQGGADGKPDGKGRLLQISMLEAALSLQRVRMAEHLAGGQPTRMGSATTYLVPDQAFQTQDRWVAVSVTNRDQWQRFCGAIGRPEIATHPDFATNRQRVRHRDTLVPQLEQLFAAMPAAYWLLTLRRAQVPCALFASMDEFRHHSHYLENGMIASIDTPHWGRMMMGGLPWHFSATPAQLRAGTLPGECTREIVDGNWPPQDAGHAISAG